MIDDKMIPKMISIEDTAKLFGISKYAVRKLVLGGEVKATRIGRSKILVNAEDMARYFNSNYISE